MANIQEARPTTSCHRNTSNCPDLECCNQCRTGKQQVIHCRPCPSVSAIDSSAWIVPKVLVLAFRRTFHARAKERSRVLQEKWIQFAIIVTNKFLLNVHIGLTGFHTPLLQRTVELTVWIFELNPALQVTFRTIPCPNDSFWFFAGFKISICMFSRSTKCSQGPRWRFFFPAARSATSSLSSPTKKKL